MLYLFISDFSPQLTSKRSSIVLDETHDFNVINLTLVCQHMQNLAYLFHCLEKSATNYYLLDANRSDSASPTCKMPSELSATWRPLGYRCRHSQTLIRWSPPLVQDMVGCPRFQDSLGFEVLASILTESKALLKLRFQSGSHSPVELHCLLVASPLENCTMFGVNDVD